jgi:PhzF family phenazine biosynthesis protein
MQKIKFYQVDAFTDKLFAGNPAAVCILDSWLNDELMQSIANENNLSETAFIVPVGEIFEIRWFTPTVEVELCGHATLASSYVIFNMLNYHNTTITFFSPISGMLSVEKKEDMLFLDFPTDNIELIKNEQNVIIEKCIGIKPIELYKGNVDYIAVIENETTLRLLHPNLSEISKLNSRGLIITAKGDEVDFVSRYFGPQCGIDEDPVTGSAHTSLLPIWSKKLNKKRMIARQLSKRGGQLWCELKEDRCIIGGKAQLYLVGEIVTNL